MKRVIHLERHGRSIQVVEFELEGAAVTMSWGTRGRLSAEPKVLEFSDEAVALSNVEHRVRRLEAKGYIAGWHNPELFALITQKPTAPDAYLVYADWLNERRDPRGALITASTANDVYEVRRLLKQHALELWPRWFEEPALDPEWRFGFVHRLTVRLGPYQDVRPADFVTFHPLRRHPSMSVVQEVVFEASANVKASNIVASHWQHAASLLPPSHRRIVGRPARVFSSLVGHVDKFEVE